MTAELTIVLGFFTFLFLACAVSDLAVDLLVRLFPPAQRVIDWVTGGDLDWDEEEL